MVSIGLRKLRNIFAPIIAPNSQQIDVTESNKKNNYENSDDSSDTLNLSANRALSSRTRRPDRAVYVVRAKHRSQTTPPASSTVTRAPSTSQIKKSDKLKSTSADESRSTPSSDDMCDLNLNNKLDRAVTDRPRELEKTSDCDSTNLSNCNQQELDRHETSEKNHKNLDNLRGEKVSTIESACVTTIDKVDKDEKELIRASQEINRSNRKLIKQTFNSNVLEIEAKGGGAVTGSEAEVKHEVQEENDDWETLFDDNGDCLDPKMLEELTEAVGKVNIKPKANSTAYQTNLDLLEGEEFPHVLECSNFPVDFKTQDLTHIFTIMCSQHKEPGFELKWVDDSHCLVVFSSAKVAAEILTMSHPFIRMKPLKEATVESRSKAKKFSSSLQPYKQRPETCAALAKRLVSGALGVRIRTTPEERENELRKLSEARVAKERKLLAAKQREEMWNN